MISDGWHRIPGDGRSDSPNARATSLTGRGVVWFRFVGGKPVEWTWNTPGSRLLEKEQMFKVCPWMAEREIKADISINGGYWANTITQMEKIWGISAAELLAPTTKAPIGPVLKNGWYRMPAPQQDKVCGNYYYWVNVVDGQIVACLAHDGAEQTNEDFTRSFPTLERHKNDYKLWELEYLTLTGKTFQQEIEVMNGISGTPNETKSGTGLVPVAAFALGTVFLAGLIKSKAERLRATKDAKRAELARVAK